MAASGAMKLSSLHNGALKEKRRNFYGGKI